MGLIKKFFSMFKKDNSENVEEQKINENQTQTNNINNINSPIFYPISFEELESVLIEMKSQSVLVSFEKVDDLTAQRFLDILCGGIMVLDGVVQKVSNKKYYFYRKV